MRAAGVERAKASSRVSAFERFVSLVERCGPVTVIAQRRGS
jgi:hypothetical protein